MNFMYSTLTKFLATAMALLASAAFGQSLSGSFSPASVPANTNSTLTLNYAGFTPQSLGAVFRLYYRAADFSATPVFTSTVTDYQGTGAPTAGTLAACPVADTYVTLNWVNFGAAWPATASGQLGTVAVTTSAGFNANAQVCVQDDVSSPVARAGVNTQYTLNFAVTPSTAVFTISTPVNVTEGGAAQNATVTCTGAFASNQSTPVSLAYTTTNAAGNFTVPAGPLSFAACGGSSQTIAVTPRADDAVVQGTVVGSIVLTAPAAGVATLGNPSTAVVNVADNDTPPVFSMGANAGTCAEAGVPTNCTFQIVRDSGVATATTVNFTVTGTATRGTDYDLRTGGCAGTVLAGNSISHPNASPLVIDVCPIDDLLVEGSETVILTLQANAPTYTLGATTSRTQSIADDDSPQVVTVAVSGSAAGENAGILTYTFTRSGGSAAAQAATLSVNMTPPAASGRYTTTCVSPIVFAASTATATCTVTGVDNAVLDGNVNVTVGVAAPTSAGAYTVGSPASAVGVIADDEVGVSVVATSPLVTEGGLVTFTISCTGMATTSVPFTLAGIIAGDTVGGATSPISLTCGTPQTVTVQTSQNTNQGDSRAITLTLGTPTGGGAVLTPGASAAQASILDDDRPVNVPTMGLFGLGLMGLLLAGIAALQRRRLGK